MPSKKITTVEVEQGSPEWRQLRADLITGSRIASVMGVSPFLGRDALMVQMAKESVGMFDYASNVAMDWGSDHEDEARRMVEYSLDMAFDVPGMVRNGKYPGLGYSPDGVDWDNGLLLEIKCPYGIRNDSEPKFKGLDELVHYWHQCQMGMLVCGLDRALLVQWTPSGMHDIYIDRDPSYWKTIKPVVASFFEGLKALTDDEEYMEGLTERDDTEWRDAASRYKYLKAGADAVQKDLAEAKAALLALAPRGGKGFGVVVSPVTTKGRIDYARAFKELLPEADLDPFTKPATTSLRITINKDKS